MTNPPWAPRQLAHGSFSRDRDHDHDANSSMQLAIGWLSTFFGGIYYVSSGPKKPAASTIAPPINAASSDEADFIKCDISSTTNPTNDVVALTLLQEVHGGGREEAVNSALRNWADIVRRDVYIELAPPATLDPTIGRNSISALQFMRRVSLSTLRDCCESHCDSNLLLTSRHERTDDSLQDRGAGDLCCGHNTHILR